ncbi:MAG: S41 family peptidase [Algicola sp.]|nr:S41 family peptidase [Algicola sp.]
MFINQLFRCFIIVATVAPGYLSAQSIHLPVSVEKRGIWQTQGYGYILDVDENKVTIFDVTQKHCLLNKEHSGSFSAANLKLINDNRAVFDWRSLHPVTLNRLSQLPQKCQKNSLEPNKFDPVQVFDIYWQTFSEHYAYSEQKNIDWHKQYAKWRAKVSFTTTEKQLIGVIRQFLKVLDDRHAFLFSADDDVLAYSNAKDSILNARVRVGFEQRQGVAHFGRYFDKVVKSWNETVKSYFVDGFEPQYLYNNFWLGQLPNQLSYLEVEDMSGFATLDGMAADLVAVDEAFNKILPSIIGSKGLVLDLRYNGGGEDLVVERLLSYFIDKPLTIGAKSNKMAEGFSSMRPIVIQPVKRLNYTGPIVVLTSVATASAAELFTLGLSARGNVSFIGESSNGAYSDMLFKSLPNGWQFSLSNEVYVDLKGKSYEVEGFGVSERFEYLNAKDLANATDSALTRAIEILSADHTAADTK